MLPVVNRLRREYQGRIDMPKASPRSRTGQKVAGQYGAAFTPTFVFVRPGGDVQSTIVGLADEADLRKELEALLVLSP